MRNKKSLSEFIKEHRDEIDKICQLEKGYQNNRERRLWVLNDEGLYNWAKNEGVAL